jgi:hypothetical protein
MYQVFFFFFFFFVFAPSMGDDMGQPRTQLGYSELRVLTAIALLLLTISTRTWALPGYQVPNLVGTRQPPLTPSSTTSNCHIRSSRIQDCLSTSTTRSYIIVGASNGGQRTE